jgi:hypothetical protein
MDERYPPSLMQQLMARGHKVELRSRYNNGAAPVLIKFLPDSVIEAGADPFYNRSAHAY